MIEKSDLSFFVKIVKGGSLSIAAREMGVTPASISKRLTRLEAHLGVMLLNRSTRRLSVTDEGETYFGHALRILADLEELEQLISNNPASPKGLLRVNAPLGFGRTYITPIISSFARRYPDVEVQLQLSDHPLSLVDDAFDIGIRFGDVPDSRVIAMKIAANRRLVCAAPAYLKKFGVPKVPHDLAKFNCIVLRQNDAAYGTWRFTKGRRSETIKVRGTLSSNDGEVALNWALDGHGLMLRAEWDIAKYLRSGRLQIVLEDYSSPPADIFAVFPEKHRLSPKVKVFTDALAASFRDRSQQSESGMKW